MKIAGLFFVLPGFIDTHVHFTLTGLGMYAVDLSEARSVAEVLKWIQEAAKLQVTDGLVIGLNYQPEVIPGHRFPTADELNKAGGGRPVYVMESGGHWSAVNHAAFDLLDLDPTTLGVGSDEKGLFRVALQARLRPGAVLAVRHLGHSGRGLLTVDPPGARQVIHLPTGHPHRTGAGCGSGFPSPPHWSLRWCPRVPPPASWPAPAPVRCPWPWW